MRKYLLDCTLRDGGYYTNWFFDTEFIDNYIKVISKLPVDMIEIGYFSKKNNRYGPFFNLENKIIHKFKKNLKKNQKIFAMINAKEFKNIKDLNQIINNKLQNIDGLRFAINPKDLKKKIQIINLLKKKYKKLLFSINIMYLNKWHENVSFLNLVNTLSGNFFSVSFVDSYGSLLPRDIIKLSDKLKNFKCLKGLHLHNNSNLALANSIIGLESGFQIIDTTFSGIGRGAGNAQTELYLSIFEKKK